MLESSFPSILAASVLEPYNADELFVRRSEPPPTISFSDGLEDYEFKRILQHRAGRGRTQYLNMHLMIQDTMKSPSFDGKKNLRSTFAERTKSIPLRIAAHELFS